MERLTAQWGENHAVPTKFNLDFAWDMSKSEWQELQCAFDRLAAYEDTGLEPEEFKEVQEAMKPIPFGRFREVMEAERDGRCVVLPCKVGDTINAFRFSEESGLYIISDKVTAVTYNRNGYTVRTKCKFYPIKQADGYDFAPISDYPHALADYYIGSAKDAEKALEAMK